MHKRQISGISKRVKEKKIFVIFKFYPIAYAIEYNIMILMGKKVCGIIYDRAYVNHL